MTDEREMLAKVLYEQNDDFPELFGVRDTAEERGIDDRVHADADALLASNWLAARDAAMKAAGAAEALKAAADDLRQRWVKEGRHYGPPGCYSSGYERWLRLRAALSTTPNTERN